ncbi:MAG: sulfotransferase [Gammaproteobacteria bacterium]|nr:sulfotransferase [Gammaproteobacteria bacterium]MBA3732179.1 sulfotransferase [Gammaproteobacteria bacterium]
MQKYLFVLSPPYCGSTVFWRLLGTSRATSLHPGEGQSLKGVKDIMRTGAWDSATEFPWEDIKNRWHHFWDTDKPVLVEKSPPNLIRAFEIQKVFRPAYFLAMIRDPYSFCEGRRRRHKGSHIRESAVFWATCAAYQRKNIEELDNVIRVRYEDFAEKPQETRQRLLSFTPELHDIDVEGSFQARSVRGRGQEKIQNFNREKLDRLSSSDIQTINEVLERNDDLMKLFGYEYVMPGVNQSLRHVRSTIAVNTQKVRDKCGRLWSPSRKQHHYKE